MFYCETSYQPLCNKGQITLSSLWKFYGLLVNRAINSNVVFTFSYASESYPCSFLIACSKFGIVWFFNDEWLPSEDYPTNRKSKILTSHFNSIIKFQNCEEGKTKFGVG